MAETLTTNLGLHKATPGTNEPFDLVEFNGDLDKIDGLPGTTCTSGSRPGTPYLHQRIYETDTKVYRNWTGTEWTDLWTTYTPTWTTTNGVPNLGNGFLSGKYKRGQDGMVDVQFGFFISTTTTGGIAGNIWIFGLPVAMNANFISGAGSLEPLLGSGIAAKGGVVRNVSFLHYSVSGTDKFYGYIDQEGIIAIGATSPAPSWGTNDNIRANFRYLAA